MYALIAAHVSHLLLNWGNDSFVLVQRVTCSGKENNAPRPTPMALPSFVSVKWIRLSIATLILILMSIDFSERSSQYNTPASVSHAAHFFGALGGLLTGYIFLEARNKNRWIQIGKVVLLVFVYGISIAFVAYKNYLEYSRGPGQICSLGEYEDVCQRECYGLKVNGTCNSMTLCKDVPIANKCKF